MRRYLSDGGGVNSRALYLLLLEQGLEPGDPVNGFEAIFIDHGGDWPETYENMDRFREKYPVTVIKTDVTIYDHYMQRRYIPTRQFRQCTDKFKLRPFYKYAQGPGFVMRGIDAGEEHRAMIQTIKGLEARYPLIEHGIDRQGCIDIIKRHGLPVPPKSGCYFCPFQPDAEYIRLRREEPCLFTQAVKLEEASHRRRVETGKPRAYIKGKALTDIVREGQGFLMQELAYPPCGCGL